MKILGSLKLASERYWNINIGWVDLECGNVSESPTSADFMDGCVYFMNSQEGQLYKLEKSTSKNDEFDANWTGIRSCSGNNQNMKKLKNELKFLPIIDVTGDF